MPGTAAVVAVSERQRIILEKWSVSRSEAPMFVQRAQVILRAAEQQSNVVIAAAVGLNRIDVGKWRRRWRETQEPLAEVERREPRRLAEAVRETLRDAPRAGCGGTFTAEQVAQIQALACEDPAASDRPITHWTHKIFTRESLDHEYHEHDGGHDIVNNRDIIGKYFAEHRDLRRDPYYPHVTRASPQGFAWNDLHRVRYNRWLTLNEATDGELEYDDLVTRGDEDFDTWRLEHRRTSRRGCMIDAINRGRNRIDVTTLNVARFTIWLHPKMVDVSKPVIVTVNSRECFSRHVKPSLATALESYDRRSEWALIYPIKIELRAGD